MRNRHINKRQLVAYVIIAIEILAVVGCCCGLSCEVPASEVEMDVMKDNVTKIRESMFWGKNYIICIQSIFGRDLENESRPISLIVSDAYKKVASEFGYFIIIVYFCKRLQLIIGAFGCQSSMKCIVGNRFPWRVLFVRMG